MTPQQSPIEAYEERSTAEEVICFFAIVLALFCAVFRLTRGVDFTDEAYYAAVAYRFVLGDKPFVDQILVHQTAFLLFTPLVGLFHWVSGGTEGLVLFLRIMFLGFSTFVAAVVYRVLRFALHRNVALLASLFCIVIFGEWVTFCYNNLGSLFLLLGLILGFRATAMDCGWPSLAVMGLAGMSSGFSVVSYPPMALPVGVSLAIVVGYLASARMRMFSAFVVGSFLAAMPILIIAWSVGWTNLLSCGVASANVSTAVGQGGGIQKISCILGSLWSILFPNHLAQAGTLVVLGLSILSRRMHSLRIVLAAIVFLPLIGIHSQEWGASFRYLIRFSLWAPLLFLLLNDKSVLVCRLFWCVCLPSFIAALTTAWTSANGAVNAGVGLVSGAIVTMVMLALIVRDVLRSQRLLSRFGIMAVMISVLMTISSFQFRFVYGEGIPNDLTARVDVGPFWGLATTDAKAALSRSLVEDLARYSRRGRVLFYDCFPAGYLFSSMSPASNTTWEYDSTRSGIMTYLRDPNHHPVIVFEMKTHYTPAGTRNNLAYSLDDPLVAHIKSRCEPIYETPFYRVYCRKE
jgi:hypothetical protein